MASLVIADHDGKALNPATARTVLFTPGNRPGRFAEVV